MTAEEIKSQDITQTSLAFWMKEIAYQIAVYNEREGGTCRRPRISGQLRLKKIAMR